MTERTQTPGPHETVEAYAEEYRRLWDTTVATLTAAVRLTRPQHGAMDFADFLAAALGAVAANVGSAERITAGRPESWESDLLAQLVAGTIGYETTPEELAARRTEPVVVPLNVAQLVNEARTDAAEEERAGMLAERLAPHLWMSGARRPRGVAGGGDLQHTLLWTWPGNRWPYLEEWDLDWAATNPDGYLAHHAPKWLPTAAASTSSPKTWTCAGLRS